VPAGTGLVDGAGHLGGGVLRGPGGQTHRLRARNRWIRTDGRPACCNTSV